MDERHKDDLPAPPTATPPGMTVFEGPQPAPARPAGWGGVAGGVNPQAGASPVSSPGSSDTP